MQYPVTVACLLEIHFVEGTLSDDGTECPHFELLMIWHRNSDCSILNLSLHDDVAATLSYLNKSMCHQDFANILPGKGSHQMFT